MNNNRLRHNFVKKEEVVNQQFQILNNEIETIMVSERLSPEFTRLHLGDNYMDLMKQEMGRKLFKILLENDFLEIIERDDPYNGIKNITMVLRVKK